MTWSRLGSKTYWSWSVGVQVAAGVLAVVVADGVCACAQPAAKLTRQMRVPIHAHRCIRRLTPRVVVPMVISHPSRLIMLIAAGTHEPLTRAPPSSRQLVASAAEHEPSIEGLSIARVTPNRHMLTHSAHDVAGLVVDEAA